MIIGIGLCKWDTVSEFIIACHDLIPPLYPIKGFCGFYWDMRQNTIIHETFKSCKGDSQCGLIFIIIFFVAGMLT